MCVRLCSERSINTSKVQYQLRKFLAITILFLGNFAVSSKAAPDEPPAQNKPPVLKPVATETSVPEAPAPKSTSVQHPKVLRDALLVYESLDLSNAKTPLKKEVFTTAFIGFRNLAYAGRNPNPHLLTICDFTLSSNVPRLWVIDLERKKLLYNTLVAHGQGTGEEYATKFSNIENSHQSSLGFYITADTYIGRNGYSLRLYGMDEGFNHNALQRAIVIHGADYVSEEFIAAHKRLGRSWGCPALPQELNRPIIDRIKEGSVLYIHHDQPRYLSSSHWLNTPIDKDLVCAYLPPATERRPQPERRRIAQHKVQAADSIAYPDPNMPGRLSTSKKNNRQ